MEVHCCTASPYVILTALYLSDEFPAENRTWAYCFAAGDRANHWASPHLTDKVDDLLLSLVAGEPLVNVCDDVDADIAGQLVPTE
jgi:hypothetical protein